MKSHKSACVCPMFYPFFPSLRGLTVPKTTSLTSQLEIVSMVKALRLRGNLRRLYRATHSPSQNKTYGGTGFYTGQTSYLSMKVLTFAQDEKSDFRKPLLI